MKGIEFSLSSSYCNLFDGFSLENYDLYVYEDEIIRNQEQNKIDGSIEGTQLLKLLADTDTQVIGMNLQVFYKGHAVIKVNNYDEFLISPCNFVVLITDAAFVEIYAKNEEDIFRFIGNAVRCHAQNITIKTASDDARVLFSIV